MIDLFGPEGLAALRAIARVRTIYAFDFDGTLAPIVDMPEAARALPSTVALLSTLGAVVPTVILTGRAVDDIRHRLEFTPLHLIGNHGAEGMPDPLRHSLADSVSAHGGVAEHRDVAEGWLAQWPRAIGTQPPDPGIVVEAKSYSISIHYRASHDHVAAQRAIAAAVDYLVPPPRFIGGKCVVNLLPAEAPDKGRALHSLVQFERCDAAFFIGDDVTDEAAFENAPASWVTVRVGRSADSAAHYFVEDQRDIDRCLQYLIANAEDVRR